MNKINIGLIVGILVVMFGGLYIGSNYIADIEPGTVFDNPQTPQVTQCYVVDSETGELTMLKPEESETYVAQPGEILITEYDDGMITSGTPSQ